MVDLISRETLYSMLCEDTKEGTFEFTEEETQAADKVIKYIIKVIQNVPSVPAVPLDKLCELLATNADCPPEHNPIMDHCIGNECAMCWKTVLKEWMEGLDAKAD